MFDCLIDVLTDSCTDSSEFQIEDSWMFLPGGTAIGGTDNIETVCSCDASNCESHEK